MSVTNEHKTFDLCTHYQAGSWTTVTKLVIINQTIISHKLNFINWDFVPGNVFHTVKVTIMKRKYMSLRMFIK
jgi:hypothetical protein